MQIYHLSHTDLDGYGCQFVSNFYLKNVKYLNSNYGKEIDDKFNYIMDEIGDDEALILITDLNLTPVQCELFGAQCDGKRIKLILLDHHATGSASSQKFPWYYLDIERCATKITYDFFAGIYGADERLAALCDMINAVDIWKSEDKDFELGKVAMGAISSAKEINKVLFNEEHMRYMFYLIGEFARFIGADDAHIALDSQMHAIKKAFFYIKDDNTLAGLVSDYLVRRLSEKKEDFTIYYGDHKGILTHSIGNISIIGNDFLVRHPDFDFFMDVTSRKTLSFRANGKLDVAKLASDLVNGGGHVNAAGGFFAGFKDSHDYSAIKAQIEELIASKTA